MLINIGSRWQFIGMSVDESLIFFVKELFCDCNWLLEIGDESMRVL